MTLMLKTSQCMWQIWESGMLKTSESYMTDL